MTRRKPGDEPKTRSRFGCWPCKRRRIKCTEERPICSRCAKLGDVCDYTIKLSWDGRAPDRGTVGARTPSSQTSFATIATPSSFAPRSSEEGSQILANSVSTPSVPKPMRTKQGKSVHLIDGQARNGVKRKLDDPVTPQSQDSTTSSSTHSPSDYAAALSAFETGEQPATPVSLQTSYSNLGLRLEGPILDKCTDGTLYGYDQGRPDVDIPRNDDANALRCFDPSFTLRNALSESGAGDRASVTATRDPRFIAEIYYAEPVPVFIPTVFEPLPETLTQNPMNLLYFHFSINHSSRMLFPCDCPANMLQTEIPLLALKDDMLLKLMIAFAAHHRARLLDRPFPKTRISTLIQDVFPRLRKAIMGPREAITDEVICATLLLTSLEVIDRNSFDIPALGWEEHLNLVRECVKMRGGIDEMRQSGRLADFFVHWFGYLDVVGSLSSHRYNYPLTRSGMRCIMDGHPTGCGHPAEYLGELGEVSCYLAFTDRCMNIVAEIAHMIKSYTPGRLRGDRSIDESWQPTTAVRERVMWLMQVIESAKHIRDQPCPGGPGGSEINGAVVNLCYYEGALIHLYRRVLNLPRESAEVQGCVATVLDCIEKSEDRSAVFMCLPLCVAGLEALDESHRQTALKWLDRIHRLGFASAKLDYNLCVAVYETGKNWESLWDGEYLG